MALAAARWIVSDLQRGVTSTMPMTVLTKCLKDPSELVRDIAGGVLRPLVKYYSKREVPVEIPPDIAEALAAAERDSRVKDPPRSVVAVSYAASVARLLEGLPASGPSPAAEPEAPLPSKPDAQSASGAA
jgi:hypothetical protein